MPDTPLAKIVTPPYAMTWLEWLAFRYLLRSNRFDEAHALLLRSIPRVWGIPQKMLSGDAQYSSARVEYRVAIERWREDWYGEGLMG